MKTLAKLLCIAILLTIPVASLAMQSDRDSVYYYDDGSAIIGKIVAKDRKDETLEIYDRSHHHYTVLAEDARIYEGEKKRDLDDLDVGDLIRVYGRENGRSVIEARDIYRLGEEQPFDKYMGDVNLQGTIRQVDKKGRKIELTADGRTQKIRLTAETEIIGATGRRTDIDGLRKGDAVSIQGYRSKGNEIVAEIVRAGGGYGWQDGGRYDSFEGRVVRKTTMFDRKLRIEPTGWNPRLDSTIEIEVPKSALITRMGRSISVHDINTGEIIYVQGSWSRSTFEPVRIEVGDRGWGRDYDRREYRSAQGRIKSIDHRRLEFVLDTGAGERKVYCDRAKVSYNGMERDFEDLERGDRVWVQGNVDDDSVDAERIEVGWSDNR